MFTMNVRVIKSMEEALSLTARVVETRVFTHTPWAENIDRVAWVAEPKHRSGGNYKVVTQVVVDEASRCWPWSTNMERDIWLPGMWLDTEVTEYLRNLWLIGEGKLGKVSEEMVVEENYHIWDVASQRPYQDEYGVCLPVSN